jgi:hypothetical protein
VAKTVVVVGGGGKGPYRSLWTVTGMTGVMKLK